MVPLRDLTPGEFIALANAVAAVLIDGKNGTDIAALGDFVSLVGDIVATAGAQRLRLESELNQNKGTNAQRNQSEIILPNIPM